MDLGLLVQSAYDPLDNLKSEFEKYSCEVNRSISSFGDGVCCYAPYVMGAVVVYGVVRRLRRRDEKKDLS